MTYRCPICRTRRKDFLLYSRHLEESGHGVDKLCRCNAHKYPHRAGSACEPVPAAITVTPIAPGAKKRGRPAKPDALTPAQRAKAYRDRKKAAKRRNVPAAMYRDPMTGQTWTGRGLMPKWLSVQVREGVDKARFLVNPAQLGLSL